MNWCRENDKETPYYQSDNEKEKLTEKKMHRLFQLKIEKIRKKYANIDAADKQYCVLSTFNNCSQEID